MVVDPNLRRKNATMRLYGTRAVWGEGPRDYVKNIYEQTTEDSKKREGVAHMRKKTE